MREKKKTKEGFYGNQLIKTERMKRNSEETGVKKEITKKENYELLQMKAFLK